MLRTPSLRSFALFPVVAGLALIGCDTEPEPTDLEPQGGYSLHRFGSCTELKAYVADAWLEQLVQSRYGYAYGGWAEDDAGADGDSSSGGGSGPSDWSETNTQEVGVDEPDLVKTEDGTYLYVAHGRQLSVVKSWPADASELVGEVDLDGIPFALFVRDGRALVLATVWEYSYETDSKDRPDEGAGDGTDPDWDSSVYDGTGDVPDWAGDSDRYYSQSVRAYVVDLADPTAPDVLREIDIEGWYTDARMIDGDVYLVSNLTPWAPDSLWELVWGDRLDLPEVDDWSDEAALTAAADRARELLRPFVMDAVLAMDPAELLPEIRDQVPGEDAAPTLLTQCTDVYRPAGISSPGVLTVSHLDLSAGDAGGDVTGTGLMADGWQVYASQDHLYVAQSSWWWWWGWDDLDLETHFHEFELAGAETRYVASGAVDGWLLNRFAMSEYDGYLRVATTDFNWWWGGGAETEEPANNVFVLQESDGGLDVVGEVRGIAPGEQIYSARFMGERGYLVTFQQVDPFFTLDLSDPTDPSVVGELKVTGYSSYLHPAGENHVLAVGMEATEEGWVEGFAVSLFDISDFANPVLADRYLLESDDWSWSESLWDPHAFTYHRDSLAVPAYTYTYEDGDYEEFSGLLVLGVDLDAGTLTETGRISHSGLAASTECPDDPWDDCYDYGDYAWMRRSVVVEDWLYSISTYGVVVSELSHPDSVVAEVPFYPAE
ncbi:MAG: beta-propeller domain-containing protein [Alphaproteobacteria bacterium]|nr:beta-propeller domain-containing protein [Alphaproteobacteria bacterium]